jgi:hypothetical protein
MLAGAGVATADDGSQASSGAQASTGSGDADAGSKSESVTKKRFGKAATASGTSGGGASHGAGKDEPIKPDDARPDDTKPDDTRPDDTRPDDTRPDNTKRDDTQPVEEPAGSGAVVEPSGAQLVVATPVVVPVSDTDVDDVPVEVSPVNTPVAGDPGVSPIGLPIVDEFASETPSMLVTSIDTNLSHDAAVVMRAAAADVPWLENTPPEWLAFINRVGTFVYDLYASVVHSVVGAVHAPFGSTVRVERSELTIGDGFVVDADWYFPMTSNPKGIVYLQHGFLATASFYSATAAYLAEKTQSIVVAPSLTWGNYDTAKYPIVLPSTHLAIAQLFAGDRTALTASARAAGYTGALPTRVVLAGHSAGGGLAVGAGRYMIDLGAGDRLAGVLMMDGVSYLDFMSSDLDRIPLSIPVYNIGGQPYNWNTFGDTNLRLAKARPGMFTGVVMANGLHSDSMQSTNGLIQFATYLFTGFSSPWNVASNQTFSAGWIKDMFSGKETVNLYGAPGSTLNVLGWWFTPKGKVVTGTPTQLTLAETVYVCMLNPTSALCSGAR